MFEDLAVVRINVKIDSFHVPSLTTWSLQRESVEIKFGNTKTMSAVSSVSKTKQSGNHLKQTLLSPRWFRAIEVKLTAITESLRNLIAVLFVPQNFAFPSDRRLVELNPAALLLRASAPRLQCSHLSGGNGTSSRDLRASEYILGGSQNRGLRGGCNNSGNPVYMDEVFFVNILSTFLIWN